MSERGRPGPNNETEGSGPDQYRVPAGGSWKISVLQAAGICALTLACVFMLYGHRWLSGQTIFRGAIQEQYYLLGQYAFDHRIIADFKQGFFPLWNPMNALGTPLLGNMLSGVFYPLKALIYLFPALIARDMYIVLRLLTAALFTWAVCRRLKLSFMPSALAAVSFTFTGYMKMFVNENYLNADVLLPAAVLFTLRIRDDRRLRDVVLLGLVVFAIINNGHPEAAFYALLLPVCLVVFGRKIDARFPGTALLFSAAVVSGLLLSLPMLMPFIEYWFRGWHFHVPGAGFFHYPARQIPALVSPWFFGQAPAGAPFLTTPNITWPEALSGMPAYAESAVPWLVPAIGAVPLFLALVAASRLRSLGRTDAAMFAYALFFICVMFGLPGFRLIGHLPVFSLSGNFKHPEPGVALCMALLAGRGIQMIVSGRVTGARVFNVLVIMFVAILFMGVVYEPLPGGTDYLNRRSGIIIVILLAAGAWLAWCSFALRRMIKGAPGAGGGIYAYAFLSGLVAVTGAAACLVMDGYQQPMRDPGYESRITAGRAMIRLQELAPFSRVYISQEISPPNLNILYDLADLRVMDGINDRRLVKAINTINEHDRARAGTYWYRETGYLQPMSDKLNHPLIKLFGVRYALMHGPLPFNRSATKALSQGSVTAPGPGYVGRARFPLKEGSAPGLYQHPPSRITWFPSRAMKVDGGQEADPAALVVRLKPAVMEEAAGLQTDGTWFSLSGREGLAYCRYLHPAKQPADAFIEPIEMERACLAGRSTYGAITLATLPGASRDFDRAGWADFRAGGSHLFEPGSWQEVVRGETWLYRDPEALPRVFLASEAEYIDGDSALWLIASGELDPARTVVISGTGQEAETEGRGAKGRGMPGMIKAVEYSSQKVRVRAEMWRDGWMVLSDLYYPGWQASVDGGKERIIRGNYCVRTLPLSAGKHTIEMKYVPASFRIGLWVMAGCLAALIAVAAVGKREHSS
jgi:hypothetical protein